MRIFFLSFLVQTTQLESPDFPIFANSLDSGKNPSIPSMRSVIHFLLVLLFPAVSLCQQVTELLVPSEILGQTRKVMIYTPFLEAGQKCEVIYVLDAQNRELFDFVHSSLSFLNTDSRKFVVVGIRSDYDEISDYSRNNDMLTPPETEADKKRFTRYAGNADQFLKFIKYELLPLIESKYPTTGNRLVVGHSNSAFLALHSLSIYPQLFNDYIAISPNFAYGNQRLLRDLQTVDFNQKKGGLLFVTHASEEKNPDWAVWKTSREKAYEFLKEVSGPEIKIAAFPNENHWTTFAPSVTDGLKNYLAALYKRDHPLSEQSYTVTIKVTVPNESDRAFICGNQPALGDWDPAKIELTKKSGRQREITLNLKNIPQFKFTKGDWNTEAEIEGVPKGSNVTADVSATKQLSFVINSWN